MGELRATLSGSERVSSREMVVVLIDGSNLFHTERALTGRRGIKDK
jgi:hypothetical protein